ncbi:MAG: phosphate-starvation-inducible PsiE family protein [Pseudohongiellaceae bacterium]
MKDTHSDTQSATRQQPSSPLEGGISRAARLLEVGESGIYLVAGYILMVSAAGLLLGGLLGMVPALQERDFAGAVIHLLDRLLLVLMLAELTFTVRRIAHTRRLEVTSFLVIAIIASVRRMLIITAEHASVMNLESPEFQAFLAEMVVLAVLTLFLAASVYMIRRASPAGSDSGTES